LLFTFLSAHRQFEFEAVLAHNAEAALVALAARRLTGVPVVYVAHTILRYELSAYGPPQWARGLDRVGESIDRGIASRADAVVTLCPEAERALAGADDFTLFALWRWLLALPIGLGLILFGVYQLLFAGRNAKVKRAPAWIVPWCLAALAPVVATSTP
jgi:hypothetical protein